jgi:hypothetical protein
MKKLYPYVAFAGLIDVMALAFFIETLSMPKAAYQMPRLLILALAILSTLMVVEQVWKLRKGEPDNKKKDELEAVMAEAAKEVELTPEEKRSSRIRRVFFVATLTLYIVTIKPLGYFIATPLYLFGTLIYLKSTKAYISMTLAVGFTIFVYLLFVQFLNLPVPMGLLEFE